MILDHHRSNGRIIGICLGMQLLFDYGYEGGGSKGLSLIKGEVRKINKLVKNDRPIFGWKKISHSNKNLKNFDRPMYFVHSYGAECAYQKNVESTFLYQNRIVGTHSSLQMGIHLPNGNINFQVWSNFAPKYASEIEPFLCTQQVLG